MSADNGPDKECDARNRHKICLDCEKMADLMDWEPYGWKGTEPEDEEAGKVTGVGPRARWEVIRDIVVRRPYRTYDESDAFTYRIYVSIELKLLLLWRRRAKLCTANPSLYAIPNTSHGSSIEDRPQ